MTEKKRQHESADKDGGANQSAHERFKDLARRLVKVPRKEIEEEQRRYESERGRRKSRKPRI